METPEALQSTGLKKLPMLMTQKHAYTTTMAEGKYRSTDVNYHALGLETMQKIPNAIADPLMVIKSHNYDGRITVITELTDSKNGSVIVPVIVDGRGRWSNVDIASNVIASAYGRHKMWNDARMAFESGEVLYVDKKRSGLIAHSLEVQYDDEVSNDRSSADIIADLTRAVNGENAENHAENESDEVLYLDKEKSDLIAHSLEVQYDDEVSNDRSSADIIADLTRAVNGENAENHAENESDEVLYLDKEKSDQIAQTLGVQFPDTLNEDRSSEDIIADFVPAVNSEKMQKNHAENAQDTANGDKTQEKTPEHEINHEYDERWFSLRKIAKQI